MGLDFGLLLGCREKLEKRKARGGFGHLASGPGSPGLVPSSSSSLLDLST